MPATLWSGWGGHFVGRAMDCERLAHFSICSAGLNDDVEHIGLVVLPYKRSSEEQLVPTFLSDHARTRIRRLLRECLVEAGGRLDLTAMVVTAGAFSVGFQRFWATDATRLAEVLLPIPHQVSPHGCVDPNFGKRLRETLG